MNMNVLILGANSDMALAVARQFAKNENAVITLASRDVGGLQKKAADLAIRYQTRCDAVFFDATDYKSHSAFYKSLPARPDVVIVAFGYLGDQRKSEGDFQEARKVIEINYIGAVSILELIATDMEQRGTGWIICISSVAGDRGRPSNYIYGSAKGALTNYLSGLRSRVFKKDVRVLTVLPGFVRTKMTEGLDLPKRLVSEPEEVAKKIYGSYRRRNVIYSSFKWRLIMLIVKHIPEAIFKRLSL
jgi:decaprenylphospho-beta-D-erythro-pentofuranosid-2-ulose 2-reductase